MRLSSRFDWWGFSVGRVKSEFLWFRLLKPASLPLVHHPPRFALLARFSLRLVVAGAAAFRGRGYSTLGFCPRTPQIGENLWLSELARFVPQPFGKTSLLPPGPALRKNHGYFLFPRLRTLVGRVYRTYRRRPRRGTRVRERWRCHLTKPTESRPIGRRDRPAQGSRPLPGKVQEGSGTIAVLQTINRFLRFGNTARRVSSFQSHKGSGTGTETSRRGVDPRPDRERTSNRRKETSIEASRHNLVKYL